MQSAVGRDGGRAGQPLYCRTCDPPTRLVSQRPALGCLFEIVETLVLTLIIFFVIQTFVAQPYKVQQQSMEHTLEPDQYVLVDKLTPRFDTYKRGDIVVFTPPPDWVPATTRRSSSASSASAATPSTSDDGIVFINGIALDEPYLYTDDDGRSRSRRPADRTSPRWVIPEGELLPDGRPPARTPRIRATFGPVAVDEGHRPGVAALLAARHVRDPPDAHLPGAGSRPMVAAVNPALAGVALAVTVGAVVAVSARNARTAILGLVVHAGRRRRSWPIPCRGRSASPPGWSAAVLAGYLLWVATRGPRRGPAGRWSAGRPTRSSRQPRRSSATAATASGRRRRDRPSRRRPGFALAALAVVPLVDRPRRPARRASACSCSSAARCSCGSASVARPTRSSSSSRPASSPTLGGAIAILADRQPDRTVGEASS